MNIWRLIAHHEFGEKAIEIMKKNNRIAIGWSEVGDLEKLQPQNPSDITSAITRTYRSKDNSHLGGPSLWNLYKEMKVGDLVIVNTNGQRRCVFEVCGPYYFDKDDSVFEYAHQRFASLTNIEAEALWKKSGSDVVTGQNIRWTLAGCKATEDSKDYILEEGARYSVNSSVIERNPIARQECIDYHGYVCAVCDIDFQRVYGEIGKGFIHVHHRRDLAFSKGAYTVDPKTDLVPLCPNCHAMVHTSKPSMDVEELKKIYRARNV